MTEVHNKKHKLPALQRADIVLIRHRRNVYRYFLRKVFNSYWDHAALVIYPAEPKRGRNSHVIAESIRTGMYSFMAKKGVKLHRLERFLDNPKKYDIGIKRVNGLSKQQRIRVTHMILMDIDAPYWPWRALTVVVAAFLPGVRRHVLEHQRFSCSSIIQKAFFDAVNWDEKDKILFKQGVWSPVEHQELTTVADIATSLNTTWIYNKH